ncbi:MFS general substrate transporter [Ramaria rubella]|nr:MFS general substrate transporter [Ramaria rubella]
MPPDSTHTTSTQVQTQENVDHNDPISEKAASVILEGDEPPDGGYGWVIVACTFMLSSVTWGINTTFGVFFSFYTQNDFFPGAKDIDFAFVGGLSVAFAMVAAPTANYLAKRFHFKVPLVLGLIVFVLSQILAGLSTRIWQLFLTQGVLFGFGLGLVFIPALPLNNQWFSTKRGVAGGFLASGAGAGALVFSFTTQTIIERLGLRWAFFINAIISFVVLVPVVILLKTRVHLIGGKSEAIQYQMLWHPGFIYIWIWGFLSLLGYVLSLFTIATYSTSGLGLSQAHGASLQAILAAGQMVGRPLSGLAMDRFGRINMTVMLTFVSGLSCLVIWMFATSYGVLAFFAIVQGMVSGVFWVACGPLTAEIVGLRDLGSALSVLWLTAVIPTTFAEPIAVWLVIYSRTHLHRTGASAFHISIGFVGGVFVAAAIVLLGAKRWKQGSWTLLMIT